MAHGCPSSSNPIVDMRPIVEIRNLAKSYRRGGQIVPVLSDITLDIAAGEFTALMGPSGSGKSTLLNLIAGIDRPDTGELRVDGIDVTGELRTPEVTAAASIVSVIPTVREWLLPIQRQIGQRGSVVAEGRDIGTKVFPAAPFKFFLEADSDVRVARRHRELVAAGRGGTVETTSRDLSDRDRRDRTRSVAPLIPAGDARIIDTSALSPDQVVEQMIA